MEERMEIELTVRDIVEAEAGFRGVLKEHLPARLSLLVSRIYKRIRVEKEEYDEQMQKLYKEYGREFSVYSIGDKEEQVLKENEERFRKDNPKAQVKQRGLIEVLPENETAFGEQRKSLLETQVKIDFTPIPANMFDEISTDGNALVAIAMFIDVEAEAEKPTEKEPEIKE